MKYLRHFFIFCFIVQMLGLGTIWLIPTETLAADTTTTPIIYKPQIPIPGKLDSGKYDFSNPNGFSFKDETTTAPLAEYIRWVYKYLIGIVGIMATVMLMFGGFRWIMGAADSGAISEAKSTIASSLVGLTLVVTSYLILATVNPALVNVKPREIASVGALGCCGVNAGCGFGVTKNECTAVKGKFIAEGFCVRSTCMSYEDSKNARDTILAQEAQEISRTNTKADDECKKNYGTYIPAEWSADYNCQPTGIDAVNSSRSNARFICCIPISNGEGGRCDSGFGATTNGKCYTSCPGGWRINNSIVGNWFSTKTTICNDKLNCCVPN